MLQFIPLDDRWFDSGEAMPGPLVPYHVGIECSHVPIEGAQGHCVATGTSLNVATSPSCTPSLLAAPAFNSST